MRPEMRYRLARINLFTALMVGALLLPRKADTLGRRPENVREQFFLMVAHDFNQPQLCDKISWKAYSSGNLITKPYFVRSSCYFGLAVQLGDRSLCEKIKDAGDTTQHACLA